MRFSSRLRKDLPAAGLVRPAGVFAVLVAAIAIAGCDTPGKKANPLAGGGGLAGQWISSDSVFTAEFRDGSFVSTANDTGETLSTGSYIVLSVNEVRLNWTGNLSRQQNTATCQRPSVDVLNCTDQAGRTFSLRKTS
ncbi:hypothetical protein [Salaquimonas pukyongi]|uniref:hypothetical protein n=1 Tax=Salaquimonas pukyongi TaxID=2712698 RepID=UPI00096B950B|nr:hypothetical protein [Salaquimonas pukyongi]